MLVDNNPAVLQLQATPILVHPERAFLIFQPVTNSNVENIFRPKSLPRKTLQESEKILFAKGQPILYIQDMLKIYIRSHHRDALGGCDGTPLASLFPCSA